MKKIVKIKVKDHTEEIMLPYKRTVYKYIEKEMNACDECGKAYIDKLPTCIGCGRVLCYLCNRNDDLEQIQLWVGTQEEYGDNYHIKGPEDFDTEYFYICPLCKENPPEKINFWNKQKIIDDFEDKIKKVTQEMIIDCRKVKMEHNL